MTSLAPVDRLRSLPPPLALAALRQLEAELGPASVGALDTAPAWWLRPVQRFPTARELAKYSIIVYAGEYGAGKTHVALELLEHLVLAGRARAPRIIAATGADARALVAHATTGILAWRKPGVVYDYQSSKGHEGELRINAVAIALLSADAPKTALGVGADVQLLDDPPKWGPTARAAFAAALKSCRERGAITIIPTTPDGVAMLGEVLEELGGGGGVLVIDLGETGCNAGNLDRNFIEVIVPALKRAGLWNPLKGASPWAQLPFPISRLRSNVCPPLLEIAVSIDPSLGGACECGIVGGGIDARSTVHVLYDRSQVADDGIKGWPFLAWELMVQMRAEHPGVPSRFVLEKNTGGRLKGLLRAEEQRRCREAHKPEVSVCEIEPVRSYKNKCERAIEPAHLAAQEQVQFAPGLGELEGQLRDLTPAGTKSDRADACNQLINSLTRLGDDKEAMTERTREEQTLEADAQCALAAKMNLALGARRSPSEPQSDEDRLQKVDGAPVGDVRGPPRAAARAPSWRTRGVL